MSNSTKIDIPEGLKSSKREAEKILINIENEISTLNLLTTSIENHNKSKLDTLFTDLENAVYALSLSLIDKIIRSRYKNSSRKIEK